MCLDQTYRAVTPGPTLLPIAYVCAHCLTAKDGGLSIIAGISISEIVKFMPPRRAAVVMPTVWSRRMGAMSGVREVMVADGST